MRLIERIAGRISESSRAKKMAQFMELVRPQASEILLDVGVNATEYSENDNYLERNYPWPQQVTALGVGEDFTEFNRRYPLIKTVNGDGTSLPFKDREFDIAYSNAVIEHVGSRKRQIAFVSELLRVSSRGYLTTPNRLFPIEVHTRVPFAHMVLSKQRFDALLRFIGKGWAAGDYMNLLSELELRDVLSAAGINKYSLIKNRIFGLSMTYTVVWTRD